MRHRIAAIPGDGIGKEVVPEGMRVRVELLVDDGPRSRTEQARAILEAEVLKGARSGPSAPMTDNDWEEIRNEVRQRFEARESR